MIKRISILASILLIIGVTGIIFTIKSQFQPLETLEEKMVDSNNFNKVNLHTNNGGVTVLPTDDDQAKVELLGRNDQDYTFNVSIEAETLHIELKTKRKIVNFNFRSDVAIDVYLPKDLYEKIEIKSDNGQIELTDLQSNEVIANTNNGLVQLNNIASNSLLAETNNGRVNVKNIQSNTIKVSTDNGRVSLEHVEGNIVGESGNGVISLITDHLDRSLDLKTSNGKIDIQTANPPTNAILDLKTGNGSIRVFGEKDWDTIIGDGEHIIKLMTDNGKITIK